MTLACACLPIGGSTRVAGSWPLVAAVAPRVVQEAGRSIMDIHLGGFVLVGLVLDRAQAPSLHFPVGLLAGAAVFAAEDREASP